MSEEKARRPSILEELVRELPGVWRSIPSKGLFATCFGLWVLLFKFLGNSTFGYINTHSLFAWTYYSYQNSEDDKHGMFIPFLVLGFLWWKRKELEAIRPKHWLPGLALITLALLLHILGFISQQTRLSLAAFFFGLGERSRFRSSAPTQLPAIRGVIWGGIHDRTDTPPPLGWRGGSNRRHCNHIV